MDGTKNIHDKGQTVSTKELRRSKAINVDKDQQRHAIENLRAAGYIGRDENKESNDKGGRG